MSKFITEIKSVYFTC